MNARWAVTIPLSRSLSAGSMRLGEGIEAYVESGPELLWIKGSQDLKQDRELDLKLRVLPQVTRYSVNIAGQLTPHERRLPSGVLPAGTWRSLDSLLVLKPQVAAFSGRAPAKITIRLVRSRTLKACQLLLTTIDALHEYAKSTAQCRLDALRFAMNSQRQVLVSGQPTPALSGSLFVRNGCVAWPAGFNLEPCLDQTSLQIVLNLVPGDLALFSEDGHYEVIAANQFHPLTRGNVWASKRGAS
ncbi:MAG: hypothetical protein P1V97_07930 [Planctomycetota bacterium]|nr:hypothetical protein [Planctomycetota bacterium]